jgi:hypothetical protein
MRRGAESACRAVGFAEADPAGIADFAPSPPLATSAKDAGKPLWLRRAHGRDANGPARVQRAGLEGPNHLVHIRNLRFNELREQNQRFLPTEITGLTWNRCRQSFLGYV